jgi:hypothetical protein
MGNNYVDNLNILEAYLCARLGAFQSKMPQSA